MIKYNLIGIFLLLISAAIGQKYSIDTTLQSKYDYVNWERNKLDFFGESPAFQCFFEKLDTLHNGADETVRIYHIGGSHIQADIYSHRIRRYLQLMNENMKAERGLVFPFTLAGTNNPYNYKIEYTGQWQGKRNSLRKDTSVFGLMGITAETSDSISEVRISNRKFLSYKYHYNSVRIFHESDSNYCLRPKYPENVWGIENNDSLGFTEFFLKENVDTFNFVLERLTADTSRKFILQAFDLRNTDPGVIYTSIGVNGASFPSYLRCEKFEHQLKQYPPDCFIISIGTNDTYVREFDTLKFEQNYEEFLQLILRANPDAAIILTVPNDSYFRRKYANPHTAKAANAINRLAEKYDMAVWNLYEIMGGKGSSQKWYLDKLMPRDRIHFTSKGYDIKADLFIQAFFESWDEFMWRDPQNLYNQYLNPEPESE